ncbi:MAG: hypothetical protein J5I35_12325 [Methanothrix harundinacea]|nr:hypothetical protein [Methanothrix harundinacea]
MSSKDSHSQEYEVTDRDQIVPVASQGLLISQILDRLTAVEEEVAELRDENRQKDQRIAELEARLDAHESFDGRERATDRQRITALETPAPALREETAPRVASSSVIFSRFRDKISQNQAGCWRESVEIAHHHEKSFSSRLLAMDHRAGRWTGPPGAAPSRSHVELFKSRSNKNSMEREKARITAPPSASKS